MEVFQEGPTHEQFYISDILSFLRASVIKHLGSMLGAEPAWALGCCTPSCWPYSAMTCSPVYWNLLLCLLPSLFLPLSTSQALLHSSIFPTSPVPVHIAYLFIEVAMQTSVCNVVDCLLEPPAHKERHRDLLLIMKVWP